jgi:hypothetical protein
MDKLDYWVAEVDQWALRMGHLERTRKHDAETPMS